jgi:hypothetical protein
MSGHSNSSLTITRTAAWRSVTMHSWPIRALPTPTMTAVPAMHEPSNPWRTIPIRYASAPLLQTLDCLVDTLFDMDYANSLRTRSVTTACFLRPAKPPWKPKPPVDRSSIPSHHPGSFRQQPQEGMACAYSWNHPGADSLNIHKPIRHK